MLTFIGLVLLVTFVSAWTIMHVNSVSHLTSDLMLSELSAVDAVGGMRTALHRHHLAALEYIGGERDSSTILAVEANESFVHNFYDAVAQNRGDSVNARLATLRTDYSRFNIVFEELLKLPGDDRDTLLGFYYARMAPIHTQLNDDLLALRGAMFRSSTAQLRSVQSQARFTAYSTAALAVCIVILAVLATWRATRSILGPIHQLGQSTQRITEGDYSQRIETKGAVAELATLIGHFNEMAHRLEEHDAIRVDLLLSEKRRSETIVRDLPEVIVATDERGRVINFNREAEAVMGIPISRAIGADLSEISDAHDVLRRMDEDIRHDRVDREDDTMNIVVRGEQRAYTYVAQSMHGHDRQRIGYLFRLKDVTHFRQVDELRRKMISTVSHELRTPLTSMGLSLELMLEDDAERLTDLQRELLGNLKEDVGRLQEFVNDLLDLSRIDTGRVRFDLAVVAPRSLADEAVRQVQPLATRHEIQIDTTGVGLDLPPVRADPGRIRQVFNNLFSNAIRYTPYRGTIVVTAEASPEDVRFSVRDQGPGVSAGDAEHVFDRFFQVRDDQRAGGSGLGLAIVKEIVESHGGTVGVRSAVGAGSTFEFTLPRADIVAAQEAPGEQVDRMEPDDVSGRSD